MKRHLAALAVGLAVTGCGAHSSGAAGTASAVPDADIATLVLGVDDMSAIMRTTMMPRPAVDQMSDNRNLLSNRNCLGIWQIGEAAIFGERQPGGWGSVLTQRLQTPAGEGWNSLAVQSVVTYSSAEAAQSFFGQSADRWAQCTDHTVNLNVNGQQMPKWRSGGLEQTDSRLQMPVVRGAGDRTRSCQRVLAVKANVVVDVEACASTTSAVDQAAQIADAIESRIP